MKKVLGTFGAITVCIGLIFTFTYLRSPKSEQARNVLTVYTWVGFIPSELQQKFELETGIKLQIDFIDSDEALEAKLLTGKAEYDLIYPSTPYVFKHINLGLLQELDVVQLPNLKHVDAEFISQFQQNGKLFSVPYLWGSSGFAYDVDVFNLAFPGENINSWQYVFDADSVKKISNLGAAVTSSASEFFAGAALWQGRNLSAITIKDIERFTQLIKGTRPYWTTFLASDSAVQALSSGEVVAACIWNGDAKKAKNLAAIQGKKLQYVIPKEGALQWVDSLAIPHNSQNTKAAHKLIDFLLKPQHMAMITNAVHFANTNTSSKPYISQEIISDKVLYPPVDVQKRLVLDRRVDPKTDRTINRYFFKILVGY